ncbi:Lipase-3 domain-containing protein [Mycena indigotica]|uniref:Lipase-3 domain-containing protein n=1 Tax=Mycena indigotica TaxID=2126181 RepID=A0A8H6VTF0_9AGAR|nr:Lipase-3 domain-containing protein [Mycena indigotica]KAF7291301.1 Lipase-3 domain-containing protein [Mycena indigotica]
MLFALLLISLPSTLALPLFGGLFGSSSSKAPAPPPPTPLSVSSASDAFLRPGQFARAAYCSSASLAAWSCGAPCEAIKGVTFLQSGGDEGAIPLYYIAHSAEDDAIVVAHEGTDPKKLLSILNDAQFGLVPLNASRFPDTEDQNITVHEGFQKTFERTADGLLAGVMSGLSATGASKVLVTGHSLGAALSSLTGALIKTTLAASPDPALAAVPVTVVGFGQPRGGNPAFASFLEGLFPSSAPSPDLATDAMGFVTNQHDPVPVVPPLFLGFVHTQGEVHVVDDSGDNLLACPGRDNTGCVTGNGLLATSVQDHLGPYFAGLTFGGKECTD